MHRTTKNIAAVAIGPEQKEGRPWASLRGTSRRAPAPLVSWGVMLQDCLDVKAVRFYPWLLSPVAFIVTTVLGFNYFGDGVRDAADPYSG